MNNRGKYIELAKMAITNGDLQQAHHYLLMSLQQDPGNITSLLLLGWTAPNIRGQRHFFHQILERQPENPLALDGLAYLEERAPESKENQALIAPTITTRSVKVPVIGTKPVSNSLQTSSNRIVQLSIQIFGQIFYSSILYLILITIGELLFTLRQPYLAVVLDGLLFAMIILHAAYSPREPNQKFLLSLSFAPLIRLLSLSFPLLHFSIIHWYVVIGIPLVVSLVYAARTLQLTPTILGINGKKPILQVFTALAGIGFGYIEFMLLRPTPLIDRLNFPSLWLPMIVLFTFTGVLEEIIFRGMLQTNAVRVFSIWGIIYTAFLYAILQLGNQSLLNVVFVFGIGLFFGIITHRTRSIIGVALSHGLTNIMLYLICPFVFTQHI